MRILQSYYLKREHWAENLSVFLKGQFYIIRLKDQGAFTSTEGSLHGSYYNIPNVNRKQRPLRTLNVFFLEFSSNETNT